MQLVLLATRQAEASVAVKDSMHTVDDWIVIRDRVVRINAHSGATSNNWNTITYPNPQRYQYNHSSLIGIRWWWWWRFHSACCYQLALVTGPWEPFFVRTSTWKCSLHNQLALELHSKIRRWDLRLPVLIWKSMACCYALQAQSAGFLANCVPCVASSLARNSPSWSPTSSLTHEGAWVESGELIGYWLVGTDGCDRRKSSHSKGIKGTIAGQIHVENDLVSWPRFTLRLSQTNGLMCEHKCCMLGRHAIKAWSNIFEQ